MALMLSESEAKTYRRLLDGVAARSCVGTAVVHSDCGPDVYYKDGMVWTHWARKIPIEEVSGWAMWGIKRGRWFPYRPKIPPVVDLQGSSD